MKKYPFLEAIGTVDEKFLEEALDDSKEQERRHISMNKRKTVMIMIAAALIFAMAATAVAAGISKISTLGSYFKDTQEHLRIPDVAPIMRNPEDYANEVTAEVTTTAQSEDVKGVVDAAGTIDTYTPPAPGEAKIAAVSATKYSLFMTIEYNVAGMNIPKVLPEDAGSNGSYYFSGIDKNFQCAFAGGGCVSYEGDIMTFVYNWDNLVYSEDEIVITFKDLGYTSYSEPDAEGIREKDFKAVKEVNVELRLPMSELHFMESIESTNTTELMGLDFSAEISPYELIVWTDIDSLASAGYDRETEEGLKAYNDLMTKLDESNIKLHMLDGTEVKHDLFNYDYLIMRSISGCSDLERNITGPVFFFTVPIDITQIDYIMVDDARFDFAH